MSLLIYTPQLTNRIRYSFNLVLHEVLGVECHFTENLEEYQSTTSPKISYGKERIEGLHFPAVNLLFEDNISNQHIQCFDWKATKAFFSIDETSVLGFDPFAASFFLATRYEEYLPHKKDQHGRFPPEESVAFQNNFLQQPIINIWAQNIKEIILSEYPSFSFPDLKFQFIPTIDVDNAYAYLAKGWVRTIGAFARDIIYGNIKEVKNRVRVIIGMEPDPYNTFDDLIKLQKQYDLNPIYFILIADYGLNDKNVPHTSKLFQSLIKQIGDYAEIGIHPSYGSNNTPNKLPIELGRLQHVLHKPITKSRQHFLKVNLPVTYRHLIENGITDDYTMGYASELGFRAGLCVPYTFYDLEKEEEAKLTIHPFCIMEATLKYYKNTSAAEAMNQFKPIVDEVEKVNGTLYSLWHNEFFSQQGEFQGWKDVFIQLTEYAKKLRS